MGFAVYRAALGQVCSTILTIHNPRLVQYVNKMGGVVVDFVPFQPNK
jgi:hypothetical protein